MGITFRDERAKEYQAFLANKREIAPKVGFEVPLEQINDKLFPFQRAITQWAIGLGRAAVFAGVGLGKTAMQLEWARHVALHTGQPVLILAPLAVAPQTVREGQKFGIEVFHVMEAHEVEDKPAIYITNYDRVDRFNVSLFGGVVLDESGILKHYSKTFFELTHLFENTPYRLCCTATPAPNDFVELGNHAMFLGIMHFKDMLARWFKGEGDLARSATLKKHGRKDFWRWLTSWSVCISKPKDLGDEFDMQGYDLPELHIHEHRLTANQETIERAWSEGRLFPDTNPNATSVMKVKRDSLKDRIEKAVELVRSIPEDEPIVLWCDTNFEADALMLELPEAVEVRGSQTPQRKEKGLNSFTFGEKRMIISKAEIAGFGLNWQHCAHMIFVGVSFSFERSYQAIGRIYRFGQKRPVHIHLIYSETEGNVRQILADKQRAFAKMQAEMNEAMHEYGLIRREGQRMFSVTEFNQEKGENWVYYLGDCVPIMQQFPDDVVDLTVTSIPFSNLYIYSDKDADVGNAADKQVFLDHMDFVIKELLRITTPGRCAAVHVKDLPLFQNRDGVMGIDAFSDDISVAFRRGGWTLQSRITVEKDPVVEMEKTNSHGLLFKNYRERAEILRVGLPDYVLIFQKPGDIEDKRVTHDPLDLLYYGDKPPADYRFPHLPSRKTGRVNLALPIWQNYANPNWNDVVVPLVWSDINQMDVLNYLVAKSAQDERHICPLQLDLIARLIQWKSNPGDLVFDPFGGIASTGVQALKMGRRAVMCELKPEYHKLGTKYLKNVEIELAQPTLWDFAAQEAKDRYERIMNRPVNPELVENDAQESTE